MELFLAVLMAIGIFVVAPAIIGLGIVGTHVAYERVHTARTPKHEAATAGKAEQEREVVAGGPRKGR